MQSYLNSNDVWGSEPAWLLLYDCDYEGHKFISF